MITIIHILGDANLSGAPSHVLSLLVGLDSKQFRQTVICPPGPLTDRLAEFKVEYRIVLMPSKFSLTAIAKIGQAISDLSRDRTIVHVHGVRAGLLGRLATRSLPYPVIYTEHSWTKDYHLPNKMNAMAQLAVLRYLDRLTAKTIGVSQAVVDFLVTQRVTRPEKVIRIYNGIDTPADRITPSDSPTIGSVGSLTWQKNYQFIIGLMPSILKELPEARLEIIGQGLEKKNLESRIQNLGIAGSVTLKGPMSHKLLAERYKHWALYIQPSVNEAFGLAVAEAIAHGLPALGANVGSLPEIIGTKNGLFDLNHKEKTVKQIVDLLKDGKKRQTLWQEEFATVRRFTKEAMVKAHEQLYKELSA